MSPPDSITDLGLASLTTESRNPASSNIDTLSALEIVSLMNREDQSVADAVATQLPVVAEAVEVIADRLRSGGRLLYMGAGTSGRLGVLDATECPPTFNTRPEQVVGLIAGGRDALVRAVEGAEDHPEFGARDLDAVAVSTSDVVVGIATSGRTPYVIGGLAHARAKGVYSIGLSCNQDSALAAVADLMIVPVVGPEVISGSTRLKAGTATKLILNMLTTAAMVLLGKTYGNLMVDLRATNQKLTDRSRRIVSAITGLPDREALHALQDAGGELKTAIVMRLASCTADQARQRLNLSAGHLRAAIEFTPAATADIELSMDDRGATPGRRYVIGMDGGGSKTVALLADIDGEVGQIIGRGVSGASNLNSTSRGQAQCHILEAVERAFIDAGLRPQSVEAACLAVAGAGREDVRRELTHWMKACKIARDVEVIPDAEALLDSVRIEGPRLAVVSGTGSICLGRGTDGSIIRGGGWGYLLGDEGSGYAMGLAALRTSCQACDGRCPSAAQLCQAILVNLPTMQTARDTNEPRDNLASRNVGSHNGEGVPQSVDLASVATMVRAIYQELACQPREIARFAPVVCELAEHGDPVALDILQRSARDLAAIVEAVASRMSESRFSLILSGGVLVGNTFYRHLLQEVISSSGVTVSESHLVADGAVGAVHRAVALVPIKSNMTFRSGNSH